MYDLPTQILNILGNFSQLFSRPVYQNMVLLFVGHILTKGRRTITDILRTLNFKNCQNFSKYHWVLNGARWSAFQASRILLHAIIHAFALREVTIAIDTHVERRRGEKIKGLGRQRDAINSTKNRKTLTIGLLWLVASISVKCPWTPLRWALPFFTQLIPPKNPLSTSRNKHDLEKRSKHKTLTEWTIQLISVIHKWLGKEISFVLVADAAFASHKIAHACSKAGGALISRLRMDARIFHLPEHSKTRRGRPLLVGKRCPLFTEYLNDANLIWQEIQVDWYGGHRKKCLSIQAQAYGMHTGFPHCQCDGYW